MLLSRIIQMAILHELQIALLGSLSFTPEYFQLELAHPLKQIVVFVYTL